MNKQLDQMSFTGQRAAQDFMSVWNKGFSSIGQGLVQMITGAKTFGQVMTQVGTSILSDLVNIGAKMLANYLLQQLMTAFGITAQTTQTASALATGKAIELAYTPAAIAASIASYGAAATIGTVAVETALAVGQTGFAEGGIIPGPSSHRDNVMVPMARGEGVIKTAAVNHYGAGLIHSINSFSMPRHGYAEGGIVGGDIVTGAGSPGGGTSSGRPVHVNVFNDKEEMAQHTLNHPDAEHVIVRTVQKNRFDLRI
jgi:hypothetical protein